MKNKKESCEDSELFYYEHGQKIFSEKGSKRKVLKEFNEFKRLKVL